VPVAAVCQSADEPHACRPICRPLSLDADDLGFGKLYSVPPLLAIFPKILSFRGSTWNLEIILENLAIFTLPEKPKFCAKF